MIQNTQGIVLRSIKYGETSLVSTLFTRIYGVQTYLVQGIRTAAKGRSNRAGLLQPATLLDIVAYHKPGKSLQRLREFSPLYIYNHLQENIMRNAVALFSVELLFRLLPSDAPAPELFDFTVDYFKQLDNLPVAAVANFPVFFLIQCSRHLGYDIQGIYSPATPYLNLPEGGFTAEPPAISPLVADEDAQALGQLMKARSFEELQDTALNAAMRTRLMEWYLQFLRRHTEHMGPLRSLEVLQAILH